MKHPMLDEKAIVEAGFRLGKYLMQKQEEISDLLNVKPRDVLGGPSSYEALLDAWQIGEDTFPVDATKSDRTIYGTATANIAFRFWHDMLHIFHKKDFSKASEVYVGQLHVEDVKAHFGEGSVEARIMEADTIGQTMYEDLHGKFPENQKDFAINYVQHGIGYMLTAWKDS